jgi:flagellar transcriptional activator FlhD
MDMQQRLSEIREVNLAYLMLAQAMIREDAAEACYRLGVSEELAGLIGQLTPAQAVKLAGSNTMLCRIRFDDQQVWGLLSSQARDNQLGGTHATILMARQALEEV